MFAFLLQLLLLPSLAVAGSSELQDPEERESSVVTGGHGALLASLDEPPEVSLLQFQWHKRFSHAETSSELSPGPSKYRIFTYWDYPRGADPLIALNVDSWRLHAPPGTQIVYVNDTNIREFVPDTPDEYFRLPYAAAKSDFVRSSVLFHQGGLYLDSDFVVLGDLSPIFEKLDEGWDVVSYVSESVGASGGCGKGEGFSSNFMAARKGNPLSRTWWSNVKHKLTRLCDEGEFGVEKVCCHEAFAPQPEKRSCHIPWAHLEWLKLPDFDADAKSGSPVLDPTQKHDSSDSRKRKSPLLRLLDHLREPASSPEALREGREADRVRALVAAGNARASPLPEETRVYCLRGAEGLTPHLNGEIYWQPWDAQTLSTHATRKGDQYDMRFQCTAKGNDLECQKGNWGSSARTIPNFFGRTAYHLFFSTRRPAVRSKDDAFQQAWLLSELYRRAVGLGGN